MGWIMACLVSGKDRLVRPERCASQATVADSGLYTACQPIYPGSRDPRLTGPKRWRQHGGDLLKAHLCVPTRDGWRTPSSAGPAWLAGLVQTPSLMVLALSPLRSRLKTSEIG